MFKSFKTKLFLYFNIIIAILCVLVNFINADITKLKFIKANAIEDPLCEVCRTNFNNILIAHRNGTETEQLKLLSKPICRLMNIKDENICESTINIYFDTGLYILKNNQHLTAEFTCGVLFQNRNCLYDKALSNWSVKVDENAPQINSSKSYIPSGGKRLKIVQLSDFHYDPKYKIGGNAQCSSDLCCRDDLNKNDESMIAAAAGAWGDYRICDSPWNAIENVIMEINKTHKDIDYIYVTGDYVDHASWESSDKHIEATIQKIFHLLRETFPKTIPIFPIIGNHDSHPNNLYAPRSIDNKTNTSLSSRRLYEFFASTWYWLPDDARETIKISGYYTAEIEKGLRIIAINNNVCFVFNVWLFLDTSYILDELQWLHDTLLAAELSNEKVHLLAHVPSGDELCFKKWAHEFKRIVERFSNTISAQFNGHTHEDHFNLYFGPDSGHAINVAWNGGSVTTFINKNSNYRVYTVESITYQVIDHDTYIYNLTEANENGLSIPPRWFKEYNFRDAYNVSDLSPAGLNELLNVFAMNPQKLHLYWQHKIKKSDPLLKLGCDNECLANALCSVDSEFSVNNLRCKQLMAIMENNDNV